MKLHEIIASQQAGHENEPIFMIGEQLKEIAEREPSVVSLLERDLQVDGMGLAGAAAYFKKYADQNHKSQRCFCIPPHVADKLLREFYGLPESGAKGIVEQASSNYIDLNSFF